MLRVFSATAKPGSFFTSMLEVDGRIYVAVGDGMNGGGGSLCELDDRGHESSRV